MYEQSGIKIAKYSLDSVADLLTGNIVKEDCNGNKHFKGRVAVYLSFSRLMPNHCSSGTKTCAQ